MSVSDSPTRLPQREGTSQAVTRPGTSAPRRVQHDPAARPGSGHAKNAAFIVDNSVWARLSTTPVVKAAFETVVSRYSPRAIMICAPVVAEVGFSARNGEDHTKLMKSLGAFPDCPVAPTSLEVLNIQNALWTGGLVRSVGAMDALIAAYAMANDAAVLHFDSDFDYVAEVVPTFKHRWIVPRGSI